jgi:betaine reductase
MAEESRNRKYRIVHYVNQFFGGVGGEEKADIEPFTIHGPQGPGRLLEKLFREENADVEIVATVVCGDSHFADHQENVLRELIPVIRGYRPDLLVAGPAFNAGRYGMACGAICQALEPLGIPAITAMYKENPGLDQYRKAVLIVESADTVSGMEDAVRKMVRVGVKRLRGEEIRFPKTEGCFEQGIRQNYFHEAPAYRRAIDMLLRKINGEPFETEYPIPLFDRVEPRPALADLKGATIALVTSGGIVPAGNPDHIESSSASKYGKYPLDGLETLEAKTHQSAHGGYDNTYANEDPNRVLPIDMMRKLEKELGFKPHPWYYATVGNGTSVDNARKFAKEIAVELIRDGVQAVILTST